MKVSALLISFVFLQKIASSTTNDTELICPDSHPENCYPSIFVPTNEWQEIKPGQHIPPGLHVRVNMGTNMREAKILDESDASEPGEIVAVLQEESEQEKTKRDATYKENARIPMSERNDFTDSVDVVSDTLATLAGGKQLDDDSILLESLDRLSHLVHEFDFGVKLFDNVSGILTLAGLKADSVEVKHEARELSLRVLAAALRNNPVALAKFLGESVTPAVTQFFERLLEQTQSETDAVLQKRYLGVLSALLQDPVGTQAFRNLYGAEWLLLRFAKFDVYAQPRVLQILEELEGLELSEGDTTMLPELVQKIAIKSKSKDSTKIQLIEMLVDLKSKYNFKATSDLINWMVEEAKRTSDKVYSTFLMETRHKAFGNPNALRKAFSDEL